MVDAVNDGRETSQVGKTRIVVGMGGKGGGNRVSNTKYGSSNLEMALKFIPLSFAEQMGRYTNRLSGPFFPPKGLSHLPAHSFIPPTDRLSCQEQNCQRPKQSRPRTPRSSRLNGALTQVLPAHRHSTAGLVPYPRKPPHHVDSPHHHHGFHGSEVCRVPSPTPRFSAWRPWHGEGN